MPTIQSKLIRHQIFLERFAGTVANTMQRGIDLARDAALSSIVLGVTDVDTLALKDSLTSIMNTEMEKALNEVIQLSDHEADFNVRILRKELEEVAEATRENVVSALLNKPMPVGLADKGKNRKVEPAYNSFSEQTSKQLIQPIRDAQVHGEDNLTVATTLIALSAGLLAARAKSLSRSSVVHSANTSKEEVYKANKNDIKEVEWVSVLDSNTTPYCSGQDGKFYDVGTGPRPPAHYNCRSITQPVIIND